MNFDEKINTLNAMAKDWFASSQADAIHETIFRNQGYGKFADHCKQEKEEEFGQATQCIDRIVKLGGKPEFGTGKYEIFDDPKDLLEFWAKDTEQGLAEMNKIASSITDDYITRKLVEHFIKDEQHHYTWTHQHLAVIKKIGYENYLIRMMDEI